jgi:hypothetical protein
MPYLTFGTIPKDLNSTEGSSEPAPVIKDMNKFRTMKRHEKLVDAYRGHVLHGTQTLDRFYYHSLSDMNKRDHDQVVTKYIKSVDDARKERENGDRKKKSSMANVPSGKKDMQNPHQNPESPADELAYSTILKIDQLWMWVVNESNVTCL